MLLGSALLLATLVYVISLFGQFDTGAGSMSSQSESTIVDPKRLTVGSSIGDVVEIAGSPSRLEGDTWYFGGSVLYFESGRLIGWRVEEDWPLPVASSFIAGPYDMREQGTWEEVFALGDSSAHVLAVQGQPVTVQEGSFAHVDGPGRVGTESGNRVMGIVIIKPAHNDVPFIVTIVGVAIAKVHQ